MGGLDRMVSSHKESGVATGNPEADSFLRSNPNAVLVAVLLDQQMRAEVAFEGPYKLHQRLGHLDMEKIAHMDLDQLKSVFGEKPAIHRFYNMMAGRVQELAKAVVDRYDGNAAAMWTDGTSWDEVAGHAGDLPGFGKAKVKTLKDALTLFGHRSAG